MSRQYNTRAIYNLCIEQGIIQKDEIPYRLFYDVIKEFHKGISDKIITDAYQFRPSEIGIFEIIKDVRRGKTIDWGASKKRKQEIIDEGGVPFNKVSAPNGVEWFVYHSGEDYFKWNWYKIKESNFIKNLKYYIFRAATGNRRAVGSAVKQNPFADLDYGIHR